MLTFRCHTHPLCLGQTWACPLSAPCLTRLPMSEKYTVVLWTADANRFLSFTAAHLLSEGLSVANRGRIDDETPVAVGVANARRRPIVSRRVSKTGLLFGRDPEVATAERYDYLFTISSGDEVDSLKYRAPAVKPRVIQCDRLLTALESVSPQAMAKSEIVALFESVSRQARPITSPNYEEVDLRIIAEHCQRLVAALSG